MVTCAGISLVTQVKPYSELVGLIWSKDSLQLPPGERERYSGFRNPLLWCVIVNAMIFYFVFRFP